MRKLLLFLLVVCLSLFVFTGSSQANFSQEVITDATGQRFIVTTFATGAVSVDPLPAAATYGYSSYSYTREVRTVAAPAPTYAAVPVCAPRACAPRVGLAYAAAPPVCAPRASLSYGAVAYASPTLVLERRRPRPVIIRPSATVIIR